jgi:hypothetical protein
MIDAQTTQTNSAPAITQCFRCPQQRIVGAAGWHFVDVLDRAGPDALRGTVGRRTRQRPAPVRFYVCPQDYARFAEGERARWTPVPADAPD